MNENLQNEENTVEESNELFKITVIVFLLIMLTIFIPPLCKNLYDSHPKKETIKEYTYTENGETYKLTIEKLPSQ